MAGARGSRKKGVGAEETEPSKKAPPDPPKVKTKRKAGTKEDSPPAKKNKQEEGMCSICVLVFKLTPQQSPSPQPNLVRLI